MFYNAGPDSCGYRVGYHKPYEAERTKHAAILVWWGYSG